MHQGGTEDTEGFAVRAEIFVGAGFYPARAGQSPAPTIIGSGGQGAANPRYETVVFAL